MVEALKFYVFQKRRDKKVLRYRSLMIWSKKIKIKTFVCLKANLQIKKTKRMMIEQAFEDRKTVMKQSSLWKLMRVGQYWSDKKLKEVGYYGVGDGSLDFYSHLARIQKKQAFFKWILYN